MNPAIMNKIRKMQREMLEAKDKLEKTEFTGTSGGVVTVVATGDKVIKSVKIALEDPTNDDIEMLEDMVMAATNDVMKKIDLETEKVMAPYTSGMPGLF